MSEAARVPSQPIFHPPNEAYEGNYGRLDAGDLEPSEVIYCKINCHFLFNNN